MPAGVVAESPPAWQFSPRYEYSRVQINGADSTWSTTELQWLRRLSARHSVFMLGQQQNRDGRADQAVQIGSYSRFGEWSTQIVGQYAASPDFLPEWTFEAQADHPFGRNRRAGLGYRHLAFADTHIAIWSPYLSVYRGDDEYAVSYRSGRNPRLDHTIRIVQLRALLPRGRHQLGLYLAHGDYLFDALGVPGSSGEGWSATLSWAREVNQRTRLRLELGGGQESDTFRQRTVSLLLQFTP